MSRPLKVLVYLFFPAGGIGRYSHEVLIELAKFEDLDIEVVCLPEFQWRDQSYYKTWPNLRSISHPNPLVRKARFLIGQWVNPRRLVRRARDIDADIVHFCQINHLTRPWWMPKLLGSKARLLATAHDVKRAKAILCKPWEVAQLKRFYQDCDAIFVHGHAQESELMEFARPDHTRIVEVPFGPYAYPEYTGRMRELRERYGIPDERRVLLFFGNVRDDKNLQGILTALSEQPSAPHLIVAGQFGGGHHRSLDSYTRHIQNLGLAERVHILNRFIPDEEVGGLFKLADCIVLSYREDFTSQSGVLHVAAAFECPVLCTPTEIFRDTLQGGSMGELCHGFDDDALSEGLARVLHRLGNGPSFRFDGYREQHSWARNAAITRETYQALARE